MRASGPADPGRGATTVNPKKPDQETDPIFEALALRREEEGRRLWALSLTVPGEKGPAPFPSVDPRPGRTGGSTRPSRA